MVAHPRSTTDALLGEPIYPALWLVLGFGIVISLSFLADYLRHVYPPPPDVLRTQIEAYGQFVMLPFVNIPAENYRLVLAIAFAPLALTVWMLMAGTARILTIFVNGRVTFDQYLSLVAFAFFPFWILSTLLDFLYSSPLEPVVLAALRLQYGQFAREIAVNLPAVEYTALFGLGAIYVAIAAIRANRFSVGWGALIGFAAFIWPMGISALLVR